MTPLRALGLSTGVILNVPGATSVVSSGSRTGNDGDYNGGFNSNPSEIVIGNDGNAKKGYFLFSGLSVPQGSVITYAAVTITASANASNTIVNLKLIGSAEDSPTAPSNKADADSRPRTSAYILWNNISPWLKDVQYTSPDIKSVIQELVNRSGWSNIVLLFAEDNGSTSNAERKGKGKTADPAKAAYLTINYTEPGGGGGDGGDGGGGSEIGARIYNTSAPSFAASSWVAFEFDSTRFDSSSFFSGGSPTRLTVPTGQGGKYFIGGNFKVVYDNDISNAHLGVMLNGTTLLAVTNSKINIVTSGEHLVRDISTIYELSAGDYVELVYYQDIADPDTIVQEDQVSPEFWIYRLA